MRREKDLAAVSAMVSYLSVCKPAYAVQECKKWINRIYDDIERKVCKNKVLQKSCLAK